MLAGEQTWPDDAPIKPCTGKTKRCTTCNYCAVHCMCTQSAQKRQRDASEELRGRRMLQHRDAAEDAEHSISHILGDDEEDISRRLSFSAASAADDERPKIPLRSPGASLEDLAEHFELNNTETRSFLQSGHAGGAQTVHVELTAEQKQRRYNVLDQVVGWVTDLMTPDKASAADLRVGWIESSAQKISKTQEKKLLDNVIELMEAVKPGSEARATLSTVLCQTPIPGLQTMTGIDSVRHTAQGQLDYAQALETSIVPMEFRTKTYSPAKVKLLVRWLLDGENVQMVSWAKKWALTDAGRQLIPCLSRKKQKSAMWRCYKSSVNNEDRVGYSTFMMVAGALTGKQQKSVKAVDYLVAELVNQNRGRLERLIRKKAPAGEQKDLVLELRKVFDFVKSAFKTRIGGSSSACPSHSKAWGLGVEDTVRTAVLAQESTYAKSLLQDQPDLFRGCKAPAVTEQVTDEETASIFRWFEHRLKPAVSAEHHELVDEAVEKVRVFMGHQVRTAVQQDAIREANERLQRDPGLCIVIADYKMKIEPSQHRESTVEHYGKRGISYHGCCVAFIEKEGEERHLRLRYFDTVIEGDAAQDIGSTLSIVEDVLMRIRHEMPQHVESIIFQSDNARTYQNLCLPLMIGEMAAAANLFCERILHTETQDGKCIVDAHFQKVNQQIQKFVDSTEDWDEDAHKACTAQQICDAIVSDGGLPGTDISVVRIDREKVGEIEALHESISNTTSLLLPGHILDIRYHKQAAVSDTAHATSISPALTVDTSSVREGGTSRASKLKAHVQEHPLKLNMAAVRKAHLLYDTNYEVSEIRNKRTVQEEDEEEVQYLVRWVGWDAGLGADWDDSWEPKEHLKGCAQKIAAFEAPVQQPAAAAVAAVAAASAAITQRRQREQIEVAYAPSNKLPITGVEILRHVPMQTCQEQRRKRRRIESAGGQSSMDDNDDDVDDDEEEDVPEEEIALHMDVHAQAVREFLVAMEEPDCGVTTPNKMSIVSLVPEEHDLVCPWTYVPVRLPFGWAVRPAQGATKGATYFKTEFAAVVAELFDIGEHTKGCKYAPHQMHAEIIARFPERFDIPSVTEISAGVSNLVQQRKKGTASVAKGTGKRGRQLMEDKHELVFGPLRAEFESGWDATETVMTAQAAVQWLTSNKPGMAEGSWPTGLDWPSKMESNVKTILKRWATAKRSPSA